MDRFDFEEEMAGAFMARRKDGEYVKHEDVERFLRDAAMWGGIESAIYRGVPGAGRGRRFKLVEVCPMFGDEKDADLAGVAKAAIAERLARQPASE